MNQVKLETIIQAARVACKNTNKDLTKNRQRVLEVLLQAKEPVSAYELRDLCNLSVELPIRAMSVYRVLDFLESMKLVHKLNFASKYIACKSLTGVCEHQSSIFLTCKSCQKIEEIDATYNTFQPLHNEIEASGFSIKSSQLEVITLCGTCEKIAQAK